MSSRTTDILYFDRFLLCNFYKVFDEKVQKTYVSWHKSDAKFEEKLTLGSKNDMMNLVNFNKSTGTSENLHIDVLLLSKVYCAWAKKIQKSYVS